MCPVFLYSGYINFSGSLGAKSYFFWLLESRSEPSSDPLVIWLTGGPGCSSQMALLMENGPCLVNKDGNGTTLNEFSWTNKANVMWVWKIFEFWLFVLLLQFYCNFYGDEFL